MNCRCSSFFISVCPINAKSTSPIIIYQCVCSIHNGLPNTPLFSHLLPDGMASGPPSPPLLNHLFFTGALCYDEQTENYNYYYCRPKPGKWGSSVVCSGVLRIATNDPEIFLFKSFRQMVKFTCFTSLVVQNHSISVFEYHSDTTKHP